MSTSRQDKIASLLKQDHHQSLCFPFLRRAAPCHHLVLAQTFVWLCNVKDWGDNLA